MQDPLECEKMCERVKEHLSTVFKSDFKELKSCRIHDYTQRKELMGLKKTCTNYKLMRVKITYRKKSQKELIQRTLIVYPCDVIRYVRRTLDLIEVIVKEKIVANKSYYQLERRYEFSFKGIRSAVKRVQWAFDRLLPTGIIEGLDIEWWLKNEKRSLSRIALLYREKFFPTELSLSCIFSK